MKSRLCAALLASSIFLNAQSWQLAQPGYQFEFPRDHFSHPEYQTEWWYYTGNLHAADGHRYGFELTFFRQGSHLPADSLEAQNPVWRPDELYLAHLALSDIDGKSFYHTERLNRRGPGLAGADLASRRYWNGNWQVWWTNLRRATQELAAVSERFTLELHLEPAKPPVIQGQDGISRKGPLLGKSSHYISFTRLAAKGVLIKGSSIAVTGDVWMDHEFFSEPPTSNIGGWDWFAIQLDNQEELMLYRIRDRSGQPTPYSSGAYINRSGRMRFLKAADFSLIPGKLWQSPHSGARYPLAWEISVPSLGLKLSQETQLKDQELSSFATPSYWEGAVAYQGTFRSQPIAGVGYLEMTGYQAPIRLSGLNQK